MNILTYDFGIFLQFSCPLFSMLYAVLMYVCVCVCTNTESKEKVSRFLPASAVYRAPHTPGQLFRTWDSLWLRVQYVH